MDALLEHGYCRCPTSEEGPLPLSSLRLLVPPLRLMTAVMWEVVRLRNVMHYGKVEAFVSLVSEAIPDILTDRQMRLLTLGLRAKMMLQMLSSEQSEDLSGVKTYMNSLLSSSSEQVHKENEALEINFVRLVQRLLDDPKDREHFLESVFPVEYGPDFDAALETVVCEFFTRLEALLLIPDFKQTAVWISDAPSVLEDFMQAESTADDLKVLLRSDALRVHMTKTDSSAAPSPSELQLFSSLSLPPSLRETNAKDAETNTQNNHNQRESEGIYAPDEGDMETQDARCPSEEDTNIQDSSKAEQTAGGKCSDNVRVGKKVDNGASDTCRAPSTSTESPVFRSCVTVTPRRRVLYRCSQCGKCFIYRYELLEHQCVWIRAVLISDAPSVLQEYMQCVSKADGLKVRLRSNAHSAATAKMETRVPSSSEQQLFLSTSLPFSVQETNAKDAESNAQTLHSQRESEEIPPPDTAAANNEEQTTAVKSSDSVPDVHSEEEDDEASDTCRAPSASTESPVSSTSMIAPPRQRVAHKCTQCGKCFIYRYQLKKHQRLHTGENPYKCSQCGKAFRTTSEMSTHRRTQCTKAAYVCIKCGNSFQSIQDKFRHQCGQSVQKFDCPQCGKSFKTKYLLGKHELTHAKNRVFTCRQCGEGYPTMSELRSHQKTHPPELSNQCRQCGKFYSSAACLTAHELRHKQQRTQICKQCGKAFINKHDLTLHMRSHTGERPFQCTYCGKRFSVSGNLNIHVRIHTGEKPYLCSDCGKAFVSAGELQIHRRSHTGEKPYKCTVCGKGFTMASKVTVHMRVHTGERPYICSECGKGFSRGSELKKHTMNHAGVQLTKNSQTHKLTVTCKTTLSNSFD